MKFIKIQASVDVPVEDCAGCEHYDTTEKMEGACVLFPIKGKMERIIYNYTPCKQCREARGEK